MGAQSSGLFLGVTDFKASHTQFGLRLMGVKGRELTNTHKFPMSRYGLAVFIEDLDHFLCHPYPDPLTHVDKGDGVEVLLYLNMTVGMDFGRTPLTNLETVRRQRS